MPLSQFQPESYTDLLAVKQAQIQSQFADVYSGPIEVFESKPQAFRMRAEFRIWHQDDDLFYAMFAKGDNRTPIRIDNFPIASQIIQDLMPKLLASIKGQEELRRKLFQIEFLSSQTGQVLITLIYHRPLSEQWQALAQVLEQDLGVHIIGRSRKQRLVLSQDYIEESLKVGNKTYRYRQYENGFTQPNAGLNEKMLHWASQQFKDSKNDLLELYCGNGNFTCVLAQHFDKVVATEISKTSVNSAHHNFALNQNNNIQIARMSSEEFTQAMNKERQFRRLAEIELDDYRFSSLFVDPPRAGLDPETLKLARRFDNILYISCNPETLHANLKVLSDEYEVESFAIFDQFPYTHHLESGALLRRRK